MNIRIFKFKLEIADHQIVSIPNLLGVLSVTTQGEDLVLYANINADSEEEYVGEVEVQIRGTGRRCCVLSSEWRFMGSHVMQVEKKVINGPEELVWYSDDKYVWHVWIRRNK